MSGGAELAGMVDLVRGGRAIHAALTVAQLLALRPDSIVSDPRLSSVARQNLAVPVRDAAASVRDVTDPAGVDQPVVATARLPLARPAAIVDTRPKPAGHTLG